MSLGIFIGCVTNRCSAWPDGRKIAGIVMESIALVDGLSAPAPRIELHVASDAGQKQWTF